MNETKMRIVVDELQESGGSWSQWTKVIYHHETLDGKYRSPLDGRFIAYPPYDLEMVDAIRTFLKGTTCHE